MIQAVAFDFGRKILIYRNGKVALCAAYYYDPFTESYTCDPLIPLFSVYQTPLYRVSNDAFIAATQTVLSWDYAFVLKLALDIGEML